MVSGLVAGMSAIDMTWERLGFTRDADWTTPMDHPDLVPAAEAGMLADTFRTLTDDPEVARAPARLREWMQQAAAQSSALERLLVNEPTNASALTAQFNQVRASCNDCHLAYRNSG